MARGARQARCVAGTARGRAGLGLPPRNGDRTTQPELSISSPLGRKPSEVGAPPHTVAGVERSVYRKGWEQAMQSYFEGHTDTITFSMVDRVPEGCKSVGFK